MQSAGKLIKAEKWWNDKAPPVLGLAFFLLAISDGEIALARAAAMLVAFMVTFIGVAGFGHVINDLCDVDHDRAVGKHNTMVDRSRWQTGAILALLMAVAWLPWLVLPANRWNLSLIALQLLLLTVYAASPLRFKARAVPGVITDALYAYTVPALITWTTFGHMVGEPVSRPLLMAALLPWSFCAGLRGILNHQYLDADNDRRSGVTTFATRYGPAVTLSLLSRIVLPAEAIGFVVMTVAYGVDLRFYVAGVLAFFAWRVFQLTYVMQTTLWVPWRLVPELAVKLYGYELLSEYYRGWYPLFMLVGLSWRWPEYVVLLVAYLAVFQNGLVNFFRYDLRSIPAGVARMTHRDG